jgi:hypothetical protein
MIDKLNNNIIKNINWGKNNNPLPNEKNQFISPRKSNHIKDLGFRMIANLFKLQSLF